MNMRPNRYCTILVIFMLIGGVVASNEVYGEELSNLQWKNFTMQYPTSWVKEIEKDHNGQHMLNFNCTKTKLPIKILITLVHDASPPDTFYQSTPSLIGLEFGYSILTGLLGKAEAGRATVTFGQVQLGNGPAASAHVAGSSPDGKGFAATQSFVLLRNEILLIGAVLTLAPVGQVIEDPVYHAAIKEAYAIMRSMKIH